MFLSWKMDRLISQIIHPDNHFYSHHINTTQPPQPRDPRTVLNLDHHHDKNLEQPNHLSHEHFVYPFGCYQWSFVRLYNNEQRVSTPTVSTTATATTKRSSTKTTRPVWFGIGEECSLGSRAKRKQRSRNCIIIITSSANRGDLWNDKILHGIWNGECHSQSFRTTPADGSGCRDSCKTQSSNNNYPTLETNISSSRRAQTVSPPCLCHCSNNSSDKRQHEVCARSSRHDGHHSEFWLEHGMGRNAYSWTTSQAAARCFVAINAFRHYHYYYQ